MSKHKSDDKKKKKKSSQLVIRIDAGERDAFVTLCDALDTSAAREIRRFMREWVAAHAPKPDGEQASEAVEKPTEPAQDAAATSQEDGPAKAKSASRSKRKPAVEATA